MSYKYNELREGFETAFIDGNLAANSEYKPEFISNLPEVGKKVIASIEDELMRCEEFQISVAFITMGGITPLLLTLKELERRGVPGKILTTNYLNFSEPDALKKLNELKNIEIKMYDCDRAERGFHTKGYIFKKDETYRVIIGSSNLTRTALTTNREWNTRYISTEHGEMAREVLSEFYELWNSEYSLPYDEFYELYKQRYTIIKRQQEIARKEEIPSLQKYRLKPNSMQEQFIVNLRKIIDAGEDRALLISSTGTGKTYASAFAMRELGFKRVLFLVHRGQLARQTLRSYKNVFDGSVTMGLLGAGSKEYECDYVFATVQTLNKEQHLFQYEKNAFDCIILDEAHHSIANTYQKVMEYFEPKLFLGMTATPDIRGDNVSGRNIYENFNYQIAHEIRLQQAMEDDLLCPFHYFGITDIHSIEGDNKKKLSPEEFNILTSEQRVEHIIEQANYYGFSGERVKGLIFCRSIDESQTLAKLFNQRGYRTIALNGSASQEEREEAFERLAMNENEATAEMKPLDYIFSVEILNEGVDIVEVNQVIMLRPTESPVVFIQQLGRGLRKAEGKEYVVVLDFIGNYSNNFMIPIALSGDRTYNADTIRKYMTSGNNTIPGSSTIHFDEISKDKIFKSIDKIKGIKTYIKEGYVSLKNRLGRIPYLYDFYEKQEIDPMLIIREYKTYYNFIQSVEKENIEFSLSEQDQLTLEYYSKSILSGVRPNELEILNAIMAGEFDVESFGNYFKRKYGEEIEASDINYAMNILSGNFVSNEDERKRFSHIDVVTYDEKNAIRRMNSYASRLTNELFRHQMEDLVSVGLARYNDFYAKGNKVLGRFVLYEKYTRRDVSYLMNCEKDLSSIMYGMKRIGDDVFIFVTYHKEKPEDAEKKFLEGKPDYADEFISDMIFKWDSKIGNALGGKYMDDVMTATRKHLFVKKSDAEKSFYYMGQFDITDAYNDKKQDNKGRMQDIAKVTARMHVPVREDILRYLQSYIEE